MRELLARGPVLLAPDNFTPLTRTPWGGLAIGRGLKSALVPEAAGLRIGESWEFSCDSEFPSRAEGLGLSLEELVRLFPEDVLSPARAAEGKGCEVLVKLLNAAEPLSLQVHPADDDPGLAPSECGKPESWLVLEAEPGAGIYLGFSRAMTRAALRFALESGADVGELLHFEPVQRGDYFEIGPGVPHSIGPGVTLLEPQRTVAAKHGKTYRLYDWGRLYDAKGQLDPRNGRPRAMHLDEGLPLVDPETQVGAGFAACLRRQAVKLSLPVSLVAKGVQALAFPANDHYQTLLVRLPQGTACRMRISDGFGALVTLAGAVDCRDSRLVTGQSALLPHAAMPIRMSADHASELAVVIPAGAALELLET